MESLCKAIGKGKRLSEDEIIQKLSKALDNGGDIDFVFSQKSGKDIYSGTILHYAIENEYQRLVELALDKGASIAAKLTSEGEHLRNWNALELAAQGYESYEILKKRSLQLYAPHGLTPFHLECAIDLKQWKAKAVKGLKNAAVNAAVSDESPLWAGMTPLLVAAKFDNLRLVSGLLNHGADSAARDSEGNTALHYLSCYADVDGRLFAQDGRDTFSPHTGESHLHYACRSCEFDLEGALEIVKRYLDQGISPDLPIRSVPGVDEDDSDSGKTGLHIAAEILCPELMELLLEYGADPDKEDDRGCTPLWLLADDKQSFYKYNDCIPLFMETGANFEKFLNLEEWVEYISEDYDECVPWAFLGCVVRLNALKESLVPEKLQEIYRQVVKRQNEEKNWNEDLCAAICAEELQELCSLDLLPILENTAVVDRDFKRKFGWIDNSIEFESYPLYGRLLKMRIKRYFVEYEKKKTGVAEAVPRLQSMFQSLCHLPDLCAEMILWNFNGKELDQFMAKQ